MDNAQRRKWRRATGNASTKKYEKSPKGFLMRVYRNMQSRVTGVQAEKHYLYEGKKLLGRQEFYEWAMADETFNRLFPEWVQHGYDRKLTPSVDRKNSLLGYELPNMEWVTHSENSRRGARTRDRNMGFISKPPKDPR